METETVVVGAGPAGLSVATCLARAGRAFELVERADTVGSAWRNHYERLHLHTDKGHSELPFHQFPHDTEKYLSREAFVGYLDSYAAVLAPHLGETVTAARRVDDHWDVSTSRTVGREGNDLVFVRRASELVANDDALLVVMLPSHRLKHERANSKESPPLRRSSRSDLEVGCCLYCLIHASVGGRLRSFCVNRINPRVTPRGVSEYVGARHAGLEATLCTNPATKD